MHACAYVCAHAQNVSQRARGRGRARARRERASTDYVLLCCTYVGMHVCKYVCMYVCMHICKSAYIDPRFECACARVLCVSACGRTLAVLSARLLDVHPYVHECECMHVHIDPCTGAHMEPGSGCKCACARVRVYECVRAQRERRKRARARHVHQFVHLDRCI